MMLRKKANLLIIIIFRNLLSGTVIGGMAARRIGNAVVVFLLAEPISKLPKSAGVLAVTGAHALVHSAFTTDVHHFEAHKAIHAHSIFAIGLPRCRRLAAETVGKRGQIYF